MDVVLHYRGVRGDARVRYGEHAGAQGDPQTEHARPEARDARRQQPAAFGHGNADPSRGDGSGSRGGAPVDLGLGKWG